MQLLVFQYVDIIHPRHLLVEAHDEFSVLVGLHHIPHFGLAIAEAAFFSQFVVGMHLHRKPVVGIDNFQQQRKLFAVFVEDALTDKVAHKSLHQVVDFVAFEVTVGDFALLVPKAREQPHLTAVGQFAIVHSKDFLDF